MHDLNDFYYFVKTVEHGGFAPAGRALGIPKSKLSRRIASLEEKLGVTQKRKYQIIIARTAIQCGLLSFMPVLRHSFIALA